ncbi:lipase family protein [Mycobacterium sp. ITM-2016-00318]|uniref:lipase family protein n=1 Tax=Mycobacterium sp. ITM-2016-00318 TaxID=2099693 RepID=UPI000CF84876|nr:lipase family protein [Mycobacterium sp. ITM-2016-00318]WNG93564.1 lipase family protein [Mycobacterium sp. ITM-2016-00318]
MDMRNERTGATAEWPGVASHEYLEAGIRPIVPGADPFYQPPSGAEGAAPGTVLRSRDVQLAFLGLIPQRFNATQLLYRTTDMNNAPLTTVTTVLAPAERGPEKPCPIVSYQCAIDAVADRCFPSYALRRRAKAVGALAQFELLLIAAVLAEGWAVSLPDHGGPHGVFGAPVEPGYCVLDGLRAALNFAPLNLSRSAPVGLWGYSGGGLATAWAAEMYAGYAPELNIVGAVLGSPVGDLGNTYHRLNGKFFSGLPTMVVAALMHTYPDFKRVIEERVTPEGQAMLDRLKTMTTAHAVTRLRKKDMATMLDRPLDEILAMPEVQHVFDSIRLGVAAPTMPVLIVQAAHDRIISVDDIDALADSYKAGGTDVTYHRDRFCEHILLHPMSAPMTLRWLRDRFTGRPPDLHRKRTTWPTLFNPSTYRGMARLARISAKVITGRPIERRPLSQFDK